MNEPLYIRPCPHFFTCEPASWWRRLTRDEWTETALWGLRDRVLDPLAVLGEPRWPMAVSGDPAAAVGVAIRFKHAKAAPSLRDAACSTLIRPAIGGDHTCVALLVHLLTRRLEEDPDCRRAQESWVEQLVVSIDARDRAREKKRALRDTRRGSPDGVQN